MRITLHIDTNLPRREFVARALRGLVTTTDEAEALRAALEETVADVPTMSDATVAAALRMNEGNIKRTAESLGIARSTVRARVARAKKSGG